VDIGRWLPGDGTVYEKVKGLLP